MHSLLPWELGLLLACSSGLPVLNPFLTPLPPSSSSPLSLSYPFLAGGISLVLLPISVLAVARGGPLKGSQAALGPASLYLFSKDGKQTLFRTVSTRSDLSKAIIYRPVKENLGIHCCSSFKALTASQKPPSMPMVVPLVWAHCEDRKRKIVLAEKPNGYEVT